MFMARIDVITGICLSERVYVLWGGKGARHTISNHELHVSLAVTLIRCVRPYSDIMIFTLRAS